MKIVSEPAAPGRLRRSAISGGKKETWCNARSGVDRRRASRVPLLLFSVPAVTSAIVPLAAETLRYWIGRLPQKPGAARLMVELESLLNLHYRYRFDPKGISPADKEVLTSGAQSWLKAYHESEQGS